MRGDSAVKVAVLVGIAGGAGIACTSLEGLTGGADASRGADAPFDTQGEGLTEGGSDSGTARTYASEVLVDHPVAYWRLGESAGPTAKDTSAGMHAGMYLGGVTFSRPGAIAGDPDTAVGLNGTDAYMTAGNLFAFAGAAQFSIEAWVKPILIDMTRMVISKHDTGVVGYEFWSGTSGLVFRRESADAGAAGVTASVIPAGMYTHVVCTFDGTLIRIYVNGTQVTEQSSPQLLDSTAVPFFVGGSQDNLPSFLGDLDEVAVYDYELPAVRVGVHFHVGVGLAP
jgi:hypothetical protein